MSHPRPIALTVRSRRSLTLLLFVLVLPTEALAQEGATLSGRALSYIYYAARNVPQGRERARSSLDLAATWPLMNERAEVVFTFTDMLNDFAVQRDIDGEGFTALYENFLETQVATVGMGVRL